MTDPLRIGFAGSGFIANFHIESLKGVRDVVVGGVTSPTRAHREAAAEKADALGLGPARAFDSLSEMAHSGAIDAIWIVAPNDTRLAVMQEIVEAKAGGAPIVAVACEKPLARTLSEARRMLALAEEAGLLHGYLENQVFSTAVLRGKEIVWRRAVPSTGRPYIARATEEHSGPHEPWFWQGDKQGGGVLSDMMCHSAEIGRFLLTPPGAERSTLTLKSANATTATLKWLRERYAADLKSRMGVDFARRPVEDFARGLLTFEDADGNELIVETTTSWVYVGAGLRIELELLGPEYAMEFSSLSSGLKVFMSREVRGEAGEDLVEKQNAEQGLMPIVEDEAGTYGYTDENRHMVERFRAGRMPMENFSDGVGVMEMLMGLYKSADTGTTVHFPDDTLEDYVPEAAR